MKTKSSRVWRSWTVRPPDTFHNEYKSNSRRRFKCRQKLVLVLPPLILQQWYDIRFLNRLSVPFQLFSAGLVPDTHISCHIIVVVSMPPPDFLSLESWSCKGKNLITRLWILSHKVGKVFTSRNRNNKLTVVKLCIVHWKSNSKIKSWGVEDSRRDS